jgi:hypothetical protein
MACKRSAVRSRLAPPMSPSSRGPGHCPFTAITGVRIPLGTKLREYMKRKIVFASALATLLIVTSASAGGPETIIEPDYFSGFFVGATGAFHMAAFNGSSSIVAPEDVVVTGVVPEGDPVPTATVFSAGTLTSNDISSSAYDGYGGVQGGVGKVFNHRWYMGIMGFGEWGRQNAYADNSSNFSTRGVITGLPFPNVITTGHYASNTSLKLSNDYGVAVKPGFLVAPKSMVYGKIGVIWADLQVANSVSGEDSATTQDPVTGVNQLTYSGTFTGQSSNTETKIALLLGIGFEQFIFQDFVTFNVEYNYVNYGSVTTSPDIVGNGTVISPDSGISSTTLNSPVISQATSNARISTLLFGLNVYFGSHWF